MALQKWFKGYAIYSIVILIGLLLVGNIYLIYKNNRVIEYNKRLYEKAEKIKVNTVEIIRNLHLLDMSLRSYALVKQGKYLVLVDSCINAKDAIFNHLEEALDDQHYPMHQFYRMRDSVNVYYGIVHRMKGDLVEGRFNAFIRLLEPDPGYRAWSAFKPFSDSVNDFEGRISQKAQAKYEQALKNSYLLQVVLFLITIPTLAYTAYYTVRALNLSEQLRRSNEENYRIVAGQNAKLEQMVNDRTKEILAQNEEIISQHEEIAAYNEQLISQQSEIESQRNELSSRNQQLEKAQRTIEQQNEQIRIRHDELAVEVAKQTQDLKKTNLELIEHNNRLEQFAYIISHNLKAPMARLTGLSSILDHARSETEANTIIKMMVSSTSELDHVIKDLGYILEAQKPGATMLTAAVDLKSTLAKVIAMLGYEIRETGAVVRTDFEVDSFFSLPPYIESILYNLLSNAIKYRHAERPPVIMIRSRQETDHTFRIEVADNGLGIDLARNKDSLFNLYKRFHFHVEGKGLGLYLVKTQVTALGGTITVESKPDQGTTFILLLKKN
jgi:signal transduction histidine kinase